MATKKKAGRKKKIPLAEFRAWLEGVEELQPDGWSPDKTQWALIRDKIDCIIIPEPAPQQATQHAPQRQPQYMGGGITPPPQHGLPPGVMPPPPVPGGVPVAPGVPPGAMVSQTPPPGVDGAPGAPNVPLPAQGPVPGVAPTIKTPDIDTTNGGFNSSFA